ncbi:MAG: CdaR family protein [Lachnospiraceae bacterium]|nr:CdaR family protein [Lachnospiraceae bacterium]
MKEKIRDFLTKNWGLKILAVILSIVLWIVVVSVNDPIEKRNFTAKVSLENREAISEQGKYISVADSSLSVTFRVSAHRAVMDRLNNSDFIATADLDYIDDNGRVPIQISCSAYSQNQVKVIGATHYLQVEVGEKQSKKFMIDAATTGTPADGFAVKKVTASPNVVTVEGPASIVKRIDHVVAEADVDGISENVTEKVVPVLYDSDNNEINTTRLTLSTTTVNVSVTMESVKTVPIEVTEPDNNTLPSGITIGDITVNPETASLVGDAEDLNKISRISIPFSVIELNSSDEDFSTTVDITSYLPDGVSLSDDTKSKVTVTVNLVTKTEKTVSVPTDNLTIRNLPGGYEASFASSSVSVVLNGYEDVLSDIRSSELTGSVDASGLSEGEHKVSVKLSLPDGVTSQNASTQITIKKRSDRNNEDGGSD